MTNEAAGQPGRFRVLFLDPLGDHFGWASDLEECGPQWDVLRVDSQTDLFSYLRESRFHAVILVATLRVDADISCFRKIMAVQPAAVRILLSGMTSSATQLGRSLEVAHRLLDRKRPLAESAAAIEYLIRMIRLVNKPATKAFISSSGPLPAAPQVYQRLSEALNSGKSSASDVSEVIQQDLALAAKVLKLVNSAYFGLSREITSIDEAVNLLGVRTLRGLAVSGHLATLYPQDSHWSAFSFERMNERALLVGRLAQQISRDLKAGQSIQDHAFIGGLLHDIGILIIASQDAEAYRKVMAVSAHKKLSICTVEKKMLGFFHGEAGACLLGLWGLPPQVVEAVLLHHTPQVSEGNEFKPLTAVHIADALLPPLETRLGCDLSTRLATDYLQRVGVSREVPRWQIAANQLSRQVQLTESPGR